MSGRKTFTAGEVLQAADVNDFLMDQSVMVFAGTAARGSAIPSPSEGMVTYLQDSDEVEVYTTSWGSIGRGKILQVVSTTKTDAFTTTSTTFTDVTGLSLSITPSSASSKILVIATIDAHGTAGTNSGLTRLMRDATPIAISDSAGSRKQSTSIVTSNADTSDFTSVTYLDSPATTSATTYKWQVENNVSGQTVYVNRTATDTNSTQYGRAVSSITVMEVAG